MLGGPVEEPEAPRAEIQNSPYLYYIDPKSGKLCKYQIHLDTTNIGRKKDNDLELVSKYISRYQARIDLAIGEDGSQNLVMRDLESSGGFRVNGDKRTEHKLVKGDQIKIGKTVLIFIGKPPHRSFLRLK